MNPIFNEKLLRNDGDQTPLSISTTLTPISPFSFIFLGNMPCFSGFSAMAEEEKKKAEDIKIKAICSCNKSKCLKLYCECFSEGRYCSDCGCKDCKNIPGHEEEREKVIAKTKARNPLAFRADISNNHKICRCSKSGCVKKYCECYQNGRTCNSNCKCKNCKNPSQD